MIEELTAKKERFEELENRSGRYNAWQEVLGCGMSQFDNLEHLREELLNRHLMWKSLKEWRNLTAEWVQTKFMDIEAEAIQKTSE